MTHYLKSPLRRGLAAAAVVTAVVALAGCSGSSGSTKLDKNAKVTIQMWTGQTDIAENLLVKLGKQYEKLHPNVTVQISAGSTNTDDLLQKLSAGFAGNDYPDISYAYGSWAGDLADSGRALNIASTVAQPSVGWNQFTAAARQTAQPEGSSGPVIGFPADVDNLSLVYNKTVFDEAHVPYPTNDWTWADFQAAAKKLTSTANGTYGYGYSVSGDEETTWQFWPHLWQNGGSILSADSKKATFDSPAGVQALTLLRNMAVTDKSVYLDQTDTKFLQLFASNRIGMVTTGPWELSDLKTAGTKYGVVELPGTNGNHQTVSGPDIWALFDHHDADRAYWATQFTEWLTSAPIDEQFNVAIGNLPLRSTETASAAFKAEVAQYPGLDVMAANSVNAKTARPTLGAYTALSAAIGEQISNVLQGKGSPSSALKQAAQQADKALAKK